MRLSTSLLIFLSITSLALGAPAGSSGAAEAAEEWASHLEHLRSQPAPSAPLLREATEHDLPELRLARWVYDPVISRLGLMPPSEVFVGQTMSGRLVFYAPYIHGNTMNIPSSTSIHAEQLVAQNVVPGTRRGSVHRYGWSQVLGFGPNEYRNIAVKVGRKYLLADGVPLNRMAWTNTDSMEGMVKLGDSIESNVLENVPESEEMQEKSKSWYKVAADQAARRRGRE